MFLRYEVNGYFSNEQAKKIKEKLQGKTFLNFDISYGGIAGNNVIVVTSEIEGYKVQDLKEMFLNCALDNL